jgi:hypothetical protein
MKKHDTTIINDLKEIDYRFVLETTGIEKKNDRWWFWKRVASREKFQLLMENGKI